MLPRAVASCSACIKMSQSQDLVFAHASSWSMETNIQSYNELLKTVIWNMEVSMSPLVPERKKSGMICVGHGPVHGSADGTEVPSHLNSIMEQLPGETQDQNMFQTSVTSQQQFPGSLRTEWPCTDFSHLYGEAEVPANGAPRQSGFFLPSHF